MMSFNEIILAGNAGREPELKATKDGTSVAHFPLAVDNYQGKDESGKAKEETQWLRVTLWGKFAETMSKLIKKGTPVLVSGELQIRQYTDKDTIQRTSVEVKADKVKLLDKAKREENQAA